MKYNSKAFLESILECEGLSEERSREFFVAQSLLQAVYLADTSNINFNAFTLSDIDMTRELLFAVEYDTNDYYDDERSTNENETENEGELNPIIHSQIVDGFCKIIRDLQSKPCATDLDFI